MRGTRDYSYTQEVECAGLPCCPAFLVVTGITLPPPTTGVVFRCWLWSFSVVFSKAKEVTSGVFGTLAKCIKNLNPKEDPTLVMDVTAELKKVDGMQALLFIEP